MAWALGDYRDLRLWDGVRVGLLGVAAAVALACALPAVAGAQVVNTTADHDVDGCNAPPGDCTLREAILEGDEAVIEVPAGLGDYVLSGQGTLFVSREVTIRGTGSGLATIRSDTSLLPPNRVFLIGEFTIELSRLRIADGVATGTGVGGGILAQTGSTLTVTDSEVVGNRAAQGGGIWSNGALTINRSTIASNRALGSTDGPGRGGGIALGLAVEARMTNTTISGNEARDQGGGIYTQRSMRLENVSIIGNIAPPPSPDQNGAGLFQDFAVGSGLVTTARNTLVALNANGGCGGTATFPLDSNNGLLDEANRVPGPSCNADATDNILVNVGAAGVSATLADNGGLTRTHALLAGSRAIDSGASCPTEDQRTFARPIGTSCDIGAYEFSPPQGGGGAGTSQPPPEDELPEPEAGETVNVIPEGTVKVKLPGRNRFRTLSEGEQLPVGTIVDTLKGRVTLVAAGGQTADFYDGIFKIGQGKGAKPLTTLTLVEELSCPKAGKAIAAAKKKKRRLWGDGSGKFRTKGKHSAATVVGTKWLVEDKCTSTLTRVARGRVSVRDFVKKKTVIVRAGKKYVARAKKP